VSGDFLTARQTLITNPEVLDGPRRPPRGEEVHYVSDVVTGQGNSELKIVVGNTGEEVQRHKLLIITSYS